MQFLHKPKQKEVNIMLVKCPECELQVSDKAVTCPHCGYPLQQTSVKSYSRIKNKRKRLPNGFGQISEIKNRRLRKPFRAMVTVSKNEFGRPICKPLKPESFFETYNDAYAALVEYNKNPYDLEPDITVSQLYDKWTSEYFGTLKSVSSRRTIESAWRYCSEIYNMRAKDVRARHIKGCMDNGIYNHNGEIRTPSASIKSRMKSLFNLMFDYAVEYEIVDKNYARTFNISDDIIDEIANSKRGHIVFTDEEIESLWKHINIDYVDVVLIQCYSGWRPQELGEIRLDNVNIKEGYFIGGMKTKAGINRKVPIHPKIKGLVESRYNEAKKLNGEYLINCPDGLTHTNSIKFTYDKYNKRFAKIVSALNLNSDHRPHDGRKHFITQAKKYNVDEYAIKYMVGHAIDDITEKTYTERPFSWLETEIAKIK